MAQDKPVHKITMIFIVLLSSNILASESKPWYIGGSLGYGTTTWYGLVPAQENQNSAITVSAPVMADEGGVVWGVCAGYEFNTNFAMEITYQNYPNAVLTFDSNSLYTFENGNTTTLNTQTEYLSLMLKLMAAIPSTHAHMFANMGPALIHRNDNVNNTWLLTPSFGIGVENPLNEDFSVAIIGNYTAGYGETEINPVEDFVPFLYSFGIRIDYHFI